jgi:hypothetical protein
MQQVSMEPAELAATAACTAAAPPNHLRTPPPDVLIPPIKHSTFASCYNDETHDPFCGNYATILCRFDVNGPAALDAAALSQTCFGYTDVPSPFLCCAALNAGSPKIYVVHMPSKYIPALDGHQTTWDDKLFAFLGDVVGMTPITVGLPTTIFDPTPDAWIYTFEMIQAELQALRDTNAFANLPANTPGSTQVRTRFLMFLPARYISRMLDHQGYTPWQAWNILISAFEADNFLPDAEPIVAWLCNTFHASKANNRGPPTNTVVVSSPFINEDLMHHHNSLTTFVLPGLLTVSPGLESAITHMATAIAQQTSEAKTARLAKEIGADQPTTPSKKFGLLLPTLLHLLEVADEQHLPNFRYQFAAATKKQEFNVLRDFLDSYSRRDEVFFALALIPNP